jgi:hypothetical protein
VASYSAEGFRWTTPDLTQTDKICIDPIVFSPCASSKYFATDDDRRRHACRKPKYSSIAGSIHAMAIPALCAPTKFWA